MSTISGTQDAVHLAVDGLNASSSAGAITWKEAMIAFAQSKYPTLQSDPLFVDLIQGTTGDYAIVGAASGGAAPISGAFRAGVVELDTGAGTVNGSIVGVSGKGVPTLTQNILTGAPWFFAARAEPVTGVDATGQSFPVCMALAPSGTPTPPFLGCYGPVSTTHYVFYVSASTRIDTGIAIDTTHFNDFAIGFDGVTLTPYYGNVLAGTFAAITGKSSTDLTGVVSAAGTPAAYVVAGSGAVRIRMELDKLFGMVAIT